MNLFDTSHPVVGEDFWGREDEIKEFLESTLYRAEKGHTFAYSITGMNRIGKSSFVQEACRRYSAEKSNNVILIKTSIDTGISFWSFWLQQVICPIFEEVPFLDIKDQRYLEKINELERIK